MRHKLTVLGVFDLGTRKAYARKYELPQPDEAQISEIESEDENGPRFCLDVCSDFSGFQDCKTRCVPASSRADDKGRSPAAATSSRSGVAPDGKYHACRSACQVSYGVSCDRAYPMAAPDGQTSFTRCLSSMQEHCESLCAKYKRKGRR